MIQKKISEHVSLFTAPQGGALLDQAVIKSLPDVQAINIQAVFDELSYGEQAQKVGQGGRQAAWFIDASFGAVVLRQYRRGGLMAKVTDRHYLWTGAERTRSWREFQIMEYLRQHELSVPKVLAAYWWRYSLYYTAALITARIPHAKPLANNLSDVYLQPVALEIARMHQLGVWHADLNAYNILLDDRMTAWLIDFDRARRIPMTSRLIQQNLLRLRRSLVKLHGPEGEQWWQKFYLIYSSLMQS